MKIYPESKNITQVETTFISHKEMFVKTILIIGVCHNFDFQKQQIESLYDYYDNKEVHHKTLAMLEKNRLVNELTKKIYSLTRCDIAINYLVENVNNNT